MQENLLKEIDEKYEILKLEKKKTREIEKQELLRKSQYDRQIRGIESRGSFKQLELEGFSGTRFSEQGPKRSGLPEFFIKVLKQVGLNSLIPVDGTT